MLITPRFVFTVLLSMPGSAAAQATPQLPPFSAIEVPNGGHVEVRVAPVQRVTLLEGSLEYSRMSVTNGVLVIEKCRVKCPRGYRLEVEVQVPSVSRVSLMNGGWIRTYGSFGRQTDLSAEVMHGGTIDVRSLSADKVSASVEQGGRILTVPKTSLAARVTQGGVVMYWGDAPVRSSVQHGGVVHKGNADELNLPLSEVGAPVMSPHHGKHRQKTR